MGRWYTAHNYPEGVPDMSVLFIGSRSLLDAIALLSNSAAACCLRTE
jgi:hypothetical protein